MKKAVSCLAFCIIALFALSGCSIVRPTVSAPANDKSAMQAASDFDAPSHPEASETAAPSALDTGASAQNAAELSAAAQSAQAIAESSGMNVGVAIVDLQTGGYAGYQGSEQMVSAGTIKLLVAYTFLEQVQRGSLSLDAEYVIQPDDLASEAGVLRERGAGTTLTYSEILDAMLSANDDNAANILVDAVGGITEVNETAQGLGLIATRMNRYVADPALQGMDIENYTSADDIALLLKKAYEGTFVDAGSSSLVMQALERQTDTAGILSGLPEGSPFAHIPGSSNIARNDGGVVEGEHPYVLVVLCGEPGFSEEGALSIVGQIASTVHSTIIG